MLRISTLMRINEPWVVNLIDLGLCISSPLGSGRGLYDMDLFYFCGGSPCGVDTCLSSRPICDCPGFEVSIWCVLAGFTLFFFLP